MIKITVYGTNSCSWCTVLKNWLENKNLEYNYVDVSKDENALALIIEKTGQRGIPVTSINGKYVIGFSEKKLEKLLD